MTVRLDLDKLEERRRARLAEVPAGDSRRHEWEIQLELIAELRAEREAHERLRKAARALLSPHDRAPLWNDLRAALAAVTPPKGEHTPGPWMLCKPDTEDIQVFDNEVRLRICRVVHNEYRDGTANANLIAAAPDLLACCKEAYRLGGLLQDGDTQTVAWDCLMAELKEAIAKAEGRA